MLITDHCASRLIVSLAISNHMYSGAGIGGLTCAVALSKYPDIQVDVYEAATKFGEIGAGVAVFPREFKSNPV